MNSTRLYIFFSAALFSVLLGVFLIIDIDLSHISLMDSFIAKCFLFSVFYSILCMKYLFVKKKEIHWLKIVLITLGQF